MTDKRSKFGSQPIRHEMWRKGFSIAAFTVRSGIKPPSHVRSAAAGIVPPSEELRRIAPQMLGVPLDELFTAEALAQPCRPWRSSWDGHR